VRHLRKIRVFDFAKIIYYSTVHRAAFVEVAREHPDVVIVLRSELNDALFRAIDSLL
jgi:hypothetical protein